MHNVPTKSPCFAVPSHMSSHVTLDRLLSVKYGTVYQQRVDFKLPVRYMFLQNCFFFFVGVELCLTLISREEQSVFGWKVLWTIDLPPKRYISLEVC